MQSFNVKIRQSEWIWQFKGATGIENYVTIFQSLPKLNLLEGHINQNVTTRE